MAERTSSQQRKRRSDARDERRSLATKPFEELEEVADTGERESATHRTLKHAAMTAAAGAFAAGIAGAAKALADRREDEEDQPRAQDDEPQPPQGEPSSEEGETETPPPPAAEAEQPAQDEAESPPDEPPDEADDEEAPSSTPQGAPADEVTDVVEEARRKLKELVGVEPERVSGFAHSNGRWSVTLEVVEVHRVPETTDVLTSYEVAFDDDRNLVSVSEVRRYRRSQIEGGR
jgi:Gas vesicle synthesis protein GvpO